MDLNSFIIAAFVSSTTASLKSGISEHADPLRRFATLKSSPSKSLASFWDSMKLQDSLRTFGGTTPFFPEPLAGASHHLHQESGQPVEGQGTPLAQTIGRRDS